MGLYTEYNGKTLEGFKWTSDTVCLCSKHYGCCIKSRLKRVNDSKTSQEVTALIHVRHYDRTRVIAVKMAKSGWILVIPKVEPTEFARSCLWLCHMTLFQAIQDLASVHICNLLFHLSPCLDPLLWSLSITFNSSTMSY